VTGPAFWNLFSINVIYDEIWMQLLMIVHCHVYSVRANLVFYKNKQQGRNLFIKIRIIFKHKTNCGLNGKMK
jgi:hypothetical protein